MLPHLVRWQLLAGSVAIACVSILSGCVHHPHDVVYVDRVHVDDHRGDHHDDHHDEHHDEH